MNTIIRRRILNVINKPLNPFADWTIGYRLNSIGPTPEANGAISPYFECNPGDTIKVFASNPNMNCAIFAYKSDLSSAYYLGWIQKGTIATCTIPNNYTKFRISVNFAEIEKCWCKNNTTGKIYYKGKNTYNYPTS